MGRGIEAGDGVDRQQQPQQKHVEQIAALRDHAAAWCSGVVGKGDQARKIQMRGAVQHGDGQQRGEHQDQVAREIRQQRGDPDTAMIKGRLADRDDDDRQGLLPEAPGRCVDVENIAEDQAGEKQIDADIDRGDDEHQPEQVDERGGPAPAAAAEDGGPVVQPAGGRVGGGDLRHRERDDHRIGGAGDPAKENAGAAAGGEPDLKRGDAAGEDADDGERDGEIGKSAHAAGQLLRVAHFMQGCGIGGGRLVVSLLSHIEVSHFYEIFTCPGRFAKQNLAAAGQTGQFGDNRGAKWALTEP